MFAADVTFCPQTGRNGRGSSLASYNYPTRFLRHYDNTVSIASNGGSNTFDATGSWADDVSWVVGQPWS
ncbi:Alpha-L-arabinofuranosidase B (ABFB) domain-containing protein [Streptosporangium subroseum]|uniref:Alpha-L-arabinofuranosidase B (ABFB) domain-containing protein n=1 Tax=Streptosporangium subroseum TaxID=106412 RepID=A0A239E645_9ACTN|nr:Alpha-L-arabinofuranosidase B (ABFB) domain-containing protein [Streptosporangium subroseum]